MRGLEGDVALSAVADWMDTKGIGTRPMENVQRLSGGTQNILVKFTRDGRDYVLRRPPPHPRPESNRTMEREATVLAAIAGSDVPHPGFIALCDDHDVLGVTFYLMDPVDGFNPVSGLPPLHGGSAEVQHRMGLALVEGIAALGALDYRAIGLETFGKPENYLERQVSRWLSQLEGYSKFPEWPGPQLLPGVETIARWLEDNRPGDFIPGVMHGDYHLANVMYRHDGPELAAIVDWELATIGDPLIDLGWLLATWPDPAERESTVPVKPWIGFPDAAELVDHYKARSSRDLSAVSWYAVLACFKLGILLEGTHARACAGKAPKETGDLLHTRAVNLFGRAGRWVHA